MVLSESFVIGMVRDGAYCLSELVKVLVAPSLVRTVKFVGVLKERRRPESM